MLFFCIRVSVNKALDELISYRPSKEKYPIIVSQDCGHKVITILWVIEFRISFLYNYIIQRLGCFLLSSLWMWDLDIGSNLVLIKFRR